ncbi:MAG TPA: 1-deoxy-D-xylulose-5-phosphate reductoisomerase [Candidatus Limnocylindrales bacterium]|nr:1-deoxy-D-xylulose-5-phosphate reductoisomerase [Candidatus Limnocylindrales bacterium]
MSSSTEPAAAGGPLSIALLGSTGSIGRQAVDVIERDPSFKVVAIAGGRNAAVLGEQARRLRPEVVVLGDPAARHGLGELPAGTRLAFGDAALEAVAGRPDLDLLVVGTGGMVSLRPVLAALRAGTAVATANKETLVAGGHLVMPLARDLAAARAATDARHPLASALGWVRPIDSEHSAIWQCLAGEDQAAIARLILTASGGPFLDLDADALRDVTAAAALRHPTWRMGSKITIDSATLANKGLEVIEAHWLYDAAYEAIDVVIHPQSVIHSAVQFVDGSLKAQLGTPDMRLPIQYALTYPERRPSPAAAPDLVEIGRLEFRAPDEVRFPALRIARDAGRAGPWATAALIAADEVAVARFLDGSLDFPGIPRLLAAAVERFGTGTPDPGVEDLVALEAEIRSTYAAGVVA